MPTRARTLSITVLVQQYDVMARVMSRRREHRRTSYHHGDLPNALTDAATEMAKTGGPDAVVLRAGVREAGVSADAAYRHSADHGELLQAVRQRALDALAAAMRDRLRSGEPLADPVAESLRKFRALGAAYMDFALRDSGLFRTAFCRPGKPLPEGMASMSAHGPYALLGAVLDEMVEHGVLDAARRPGAEIAVWAAVHGLATLLLDGPLASLAGDDRAKAIGRISDFALDGLTVAVPS
jgi:AcrR family transcriptional regulator